MSYYLYRHIRIDKDEPFYIGIGENKDKSIKGEYKRAFSRDQRSNFWHRIIDKTGYIVEVVFETNSLLEIKNKEKEFIKLYGRSDLGLGTLCNLTDGGDGTHGMKFSKESILKMIKAKKGKKIKTNNKKAFQYDSISGVFIREWDSTKAAAIAFGGHSSSISMAIRAKSHFAFNSLWFFIYQGEKVVPFKGKRRNYNGVVMKDINKDKEIKKFKTVSDAFIFLEKEHSGIIRRACKNDSIAYGYKWESVCV